MPDIHNRTESGDALDDDLAGISGGISSVSAGEGALAGNMIGWWAAHKYLSRKRVAETSMPSLEPEATQPAVKSSEQLAESPADQHVQAPVEKDVEHKAGKVMDEPGQAGAVKQQVKEIPIEQPVATASRQRPSPDMIRTEIPEEVTHQQVSSDGEIVGISNGPQRPYEKTFGLIDKYRNGDLPATGYKRYESGRHVTERWTYGDYATAYVRYKDGKYVDTKIRLMDGSQYMEDADHQEWLGKDGYREVVRLGSTHYTTPADGVSTIPKPAGLGGSPDTPTNPNTVQSPDLTVSMNAVNQSSSSGTGTSTDRTADDDGI